MKKFILTSLAGLAATLVSLELRTRLALKHQSAAERILIDNEIMTQRFKLITWLNLAPGYGKTVAEIDEYYKEKIALIDELIASKS